MRVCACVCVLQGLAGVITEPDKPKACTGQAGGPGQPGQGSNLKARRLRTQRDSLFLLESEGWKKLLSSWEDSQSRQRERGAAQSHRTECWLQGGGQAWGTLRRENPGEAAANFLPVLTPRVQQYGGRMGVQRSTSQNDELKKQKMLSAEG